MSSRSRRLLSLLLLTVAGAGCVRVPTTAERTATFAGFSEAHIDGTLIRQYLSLRTAILANNVVVGDPDPENPARVPFEPRDGEKRNQHFGLATAVDPRGYFLTAAHCLNSNDLALITYDGTQIRTFTPRVVWKGDHLNDGPDLAILHVTARLPLVFAWAEHFEAGDPVLAVGPNYEPKSTHFQINCIAGTILDPGATDEHGFRWIEHATPLHRGDSGGPVASADGKLIGINVSAIWRQPWLSSRTTWSGGSIRPDPDWVCEMIESDWREVVHAGHPLPAPGHRPEKARTPRDDAGRTPAASGETDG